MKYLALLLFFLSNASFACWKLEGVLEQNMENLSINQKVDHDKTYTLPWNNLIVHFKLPNSKQAPFFNYEILERDGMNLKAVAKAAFPLVFNQEVHFKLSVVPYIKAKLKLTKI